MAKRYINKMISVKTVKPGERDIYDYKITISEVGREDRYYHIGIGRVQRTGQKLWIRQTTYGGKNDFKNLSDAKREQAKIIKALKAGVNIDLVIMGGV